MTAGVEVKHVKEYLPNVVALWDIFKELIPPEPGKLVEPYIWKGKDIIKQLYRIAEEVKLGESVERRVLVPVNPGLKKLGLYTATHTIYVGFQIVMPGEVAEAHRHTPVATRFMIKGSAATTVDGVNVRFEEGDFVTTPRWAWHDHTNDTHEPVVWLDALDTPIPKMMLASFFEDFTGEAQPVFEEGDLLSRVKATGLTPTFSLEWMRGHSSPLLFKWKHTYKTLKDLASFTDGDPYDAITLTYRDPKTGKEISDTMGADITLLQPGVRTKAHRHTMSVVYYVVRGKGAIAVDGNELPFEENDVITMTPWTYHELLNNGTEEAVLFSLNDRPLLRNVGLYREQRT